MSIFVHGPEQEGRFQARQSRTASAAVARCHRLREEAVVLLAQNREAIDRGAFHNDVVAVANENVLLFHPDAFQDRAALLAAIGNTWKDGGVPLHLLAPSQDVLCLKEAVSTYLFNSQLVTTSPGRMQIIAPARCQNSRAVQTVLGEWRGQSAAGYLLRRPVAEYGQRRRPSLSASARGPHPARGGERCTGCGHDP